MAKIDLHTHSIASADGGITVAQYTKAIETKSIDIIAITDHNKIDFAVNLHKKYPKNIIVGEEIMTNTGEIIGLFIDKKIESGLSIEETVTEIKQQSGLCYIPHPLEKLRNGLSWENLEKIKQNIDILEVGNGRAVNKKNYKKLVSWAEQNAISIASSSDAHGKRGLGRSYTDVAVNEINSKNLIKSLATARLNIKYPSIIEFLYPKYNRIRSR